MKLEVVAVVGGESLLGREVRELAENFVPGARMKLIGADEEQSGILSEQGGEAVVMTQLDEETLGGAKVAVLAGSPNSTRKAFGLMADREARPALIDLTHTLEEEPQARLRAPMAEPKGFEVPPGSIHIVAHPAAIALAIFFNRLHENHPVRRAVVQVFEPASERGQRGLNELQQQTVSLLSFQPLNKDVFDEQASFNMLSRYGTDAPESLGDVEQRVDRHLASLLSVKNSMPMPSLRVSQAPVFHGYSFSIWVEFEQNPGPEILAKTLAADLIDVRTGDQDPPTNVGYTGQTGLSVGGIETDRNNTRAAWFWAVTDNLRLPAENALMVAQSLLSPESVE